MRVSAAGNMPLQGLVKPPAKPVVMIFKKQGENRGSGPCLIPLRRACLTGASNLQGCGGVRQTSSAIWFREVLDVSNNKIIIQDAARLVKRKIESNPLGIV